MISITKSRIRSLDSNLPGNLRGKKLALVIKLSGNEKRAKRVGFSEAPADGDTIVPKPVGPVTRRNTFGVDTIHRNQEKERHVRTMEWTHQEWAGRGETRTVTTLVDVPYFKYPRNHTDGPELELTLATHDGTQFVTLNDKLPYGNGREADLLFAINLFLEIFGYVDVLTEDMEEIPTAAQTKRLSWVILPKGARISEDDIKEVLSRSKRIRPVEMLRQERISGFKPNVIAVGQAGFSGYIIYVFTSKKIAVLESVRYGNASYVIPNDNWEALSKMTKQELLSKSLVTAREIHSIQWFERIKKLLED